MDAFDLLIALDERGIKCALNNQGVLIVAPKELITKKDRAAISANVQVLRHLLAYEYVMYYEGWQQCQVIDRRAVHVRQGYLLDSCVFKTPEGAREFIRRARNGEPINLAFSAACAMEDTPTKSIYESLKTEKRPRANP